MFVCGMEEIWKDRRARSFDAVKFDRLISSLLTPSIYSSSSFPFPHLFLHIPPAFSHINNNIHITSMHSSTEIAKVYYCNTCNRTYFSKMFSVSRFLQAQAYISQTHVCYKVVNNMLSTPTTTIGLSLSHT